MLASSKFVNGASLFLWSCLYSSTVDLSLELRQSGVFLCRLLFIQLQHDDLMYFYQIDNKVNSYYLFI